MNITQSFAQSENFRQALLAIQEVVSDRLRVHRSAALFKEIFALYKKMLHPRIPAELHAELLPFKIRLLQLLVLYEYTEDGLKLISEIQFATFTREQLQQIEHVN